LSFVPLYLLCVKTHHSTDDSRYGPCNVTNLTHPRVNATLAVGRVSSGGGSSVASDSGRSEGGYGRTDGGRQEKHGGGGGNNSNNNNNNGGRGGGAVYKSNPVHPYSLKGA
jgi:hypothetical protein